MIAPHELRVSPLLADLPAEALSWLAVAARELELAPGQAMAAEGDPADTMFIVLQGEIQYRREGVPGSPVFRGEAGDVTGLLPFSRMTHYSGTVRAITPVRLACFRRDQFGEMLRAVPLLEQRLVGELADRVRETTRAEQQQDKLMALGRLSAGLAHEMNNPAAALRRGTAHLRERLRTLPLLTARLAGCGLDPARFAALAALQERRVAAGQGPPRDPLQASAREEALADWMEARGVPDPWTHAETLCSAGMTVDELDEVERILPGHALGDALAWLAAGLEAHVVLREMEDGAVRISELVASVKSYSHMDEAHARGETDVHAGLESTLVMLGHRIRERGVRVERDLHPALPRPWASAADLNQVWTNLIDNAVDAARPGGRLLLRTAVREGEVVVEVHDDGPGVPAELADRIWEPFFTTKDVGEGTGLGLDIVRRIVVRQHGGQVSLQARPGDTCFQVRLPVRPPDALAAVAEVRA